jgi:orotidine-5'-phosphate decarboxylase
VIQSRPMTDINSITHPADRLLAAIDSKRAPVCVGLDPVVEKLPVALRPEEEDDAESIAYAMEEFCFEIIEAVSPSIPCVKLQSACFERYGHHGWISLQALIQGTTQEKMQIILDAKRGDIGISAEHYAAANFQDIPGIGAFAPDWLTINSYLGEDGITPFLKHERHGAFAMVRTSNPGGDAIQNLRLQDGRTVAQAVGELIASVGAGFVGERGFSSLGAVVGATKREDAARLREIMPQQLFLVPGYGAQGGGIDDVLPCFKSDGAGALVTASRSVIYAFEPNDPNWMKSVADAAAKFADEVGQAVGNR